MASYQWLLLALLLIQSGMVWLALSMKVHWEQVMSRSAAESITSRKTLKSLAVTALMLSLLSCLMADHPSMAVLVWIMLMAITALTVTLVLSWRARLLRYMWPFLNLEKS